MQFNGGLPSRIDDRITHSEWKRLKMDMFHGDATEMKKLLFYGDHARRNFVRDLNIHRRASCICSALRTRKLDKAIRSRRQQERKASELVDERKRLHQFLDRLYNPPSILQLALEARQNDMLNKSNTPNKIGRVISTTQLSSNGANHKRQSTNLSKIGQPEEALLSRTPTESKQDLADGDTNNSKLLNGSSAQINDVTSQGTNLNLTGGALSPLNGDGSRGGGLVDEEDEDNDHHPLKQQNTNTALMTLALREHLEEARIANITRRLTARKERENLMLERRLLALERLRQKHDEKELVRQLKIAELSRQLSSYRRQAFEKKMSNEHINNIRLQRIIQRSKTRLNAYLHLLTKQQQEFETAHKLKENAVRDSKSARERRLKLLCESRARSKIQQKRLDLRRERNLEVFLAKRKAAKDNQFFVAGNLPSNAVENDDVSPASPNLINSSRPTDRSTKGEILSETFPSMHKSSNSQLTNAVKGAKLVAASQSPTTKERNLKQNAEAYDAGDESRRSMRWGSNGERPSPFEKNGRLYELQHIQKLKQDIQQKRKFREAYRLEQQEAAEEKEKKKKITELEKAALWVELEKKRSENLEEEKRKTSNRVMQNIKKSARNYNFAAFLTFD